MPIYALVDGNSFYAACQIAFQPQLKNRPVVVLSNNDGCIVAANDIAKKLDTPANYGQGGYRAAKPTSMMFQPYFKVAGLLKRHNTAVFSSNYELYQDMSQRMHAISARFSPNQEVYSIDESFLDFSHLNAEQRLTQAKLLKQTIMQWIGIPVAVGIGRSKTEAKLANHLAKKHPQNNGILDLSQYGDTTRDLLYQQVGVDKIWGIGKQLSSKLQQAGYHSVQDLLSTNLKTLRKQFSVNLERSIRELNGQACYQLNEHPKAKQNIVSSRSFGQTTSDFNSLREAVSSYTATAAQKLRSQQSVCQIIGVSIRTAPHQDTSQYANQASIAMVYPSDNTVLLTKLALRALKQIWRPDYQYQKATVTLGKIQLKKALQVDLFAANPKFSANPKSDQLMQTLDNINSKLGKNTLQLASCGLQQSWSMKREMISPRYTTRWQELLTVKAN